MLFLVMFLTYSFFMVFVTVVYVGAFDSFEDDCKRQAAQEVHWLEHYCLSQIRLFFFAYD